MSGLYIPGGPSFGGYPQPPDVPCDPTGDGWRGPPGPVGPKGDKGDQGDQGNPGQDGIGATTSAAVSGVGANTAIATLPASNTILSITLSETTGNAVTVFLGTTAGAQDLVGPFPVPAGDIVTISPLAMTRSAWKAPQAIFVSSAGWGAARLNAKVWYAF